MSELFSIGRRGVMLVLSSPSGAGKTTISREILANDQNIEMSVSMTTRSPRRGEVNGKDYNFIKMEDFNLMVNRREFLEYAKVFDNYYGTPAAPVMDVLSAGQDVLFDIDWQGTQQLAEEAGDDLVSIFILPPSMKDLEHRLKTRAQDSADVVSRRMAKASDEVTHYAEYDYIIVNYDVADSVAKVSSILTAERLRRERQVGLGDFVKGLREGQ
ncbi:MAG: guanylate kinase [Alphaproteobacteria bacterium]|jgi:guanylate kinase